MPTIAATEARSSSIGYMEWLAANIPDPKGMSAYQLFKVANSVATWYRAVGRLTREEWTDPFVPLATGCTVPPNAAVYVDAVYGLDSNAGTRAAPKKTPNTANWTGAKTSWATYEAMLLRAGQTHTHSSTSTTLQFGSYKHVGAYWESGDDPNSLPILKTLLNVGSTGAPTRSMFYANGTVTEASLTDLILDVSDVPNRHGFCLYSTAAGDYARNITVRNVYICGGAITDAIAYTGVNFGYFSTYSTLAAYARSYNILVDNSAAIYYPGHGFGFFGAVGTSYPNGHWGGVDCINSMAIKCGHGFDCHAFTSYSAGVLLDRNGLTWTDMGAGPDVGTNTGSRVYRLNLSLLYGRDVPDVDIVHTDNGSGTEMFKLVKDTVTPTTPRQGDFGVSVAGGTGFVYMYANQGSAMNGTTRISLAASSAMGVRYIRCVAAKQINAGRTLPKLEGHGIAYDDFSTKGKIIECLVIDNEGAGVTLNRGDEIWVVASEIHGNRLGPIKGNFGWEHLISKCWISGAGFSDTMPGFEGFIHIAHASHKAFNTYTGSVAPSSYRTVISNCPQIEYTGGDNGVALLFSSNNNSAPVLVCNDSELTPGVGKHVDGGRTFILGMNNRSTTIPIDYLATGV